MNVQLFTCTRCVGAMGAIEYVEYYNCTCMLWWEIVVDALQVVKWISHGVTCVGLGEDLEDLDIYLYPL